MSEDNGPIKINDGDRGITPTPEDQELAPTEIVTLEVDPSEVPWTGPATALGLSILIPADEEDWALLCVQVMSAAIRAKGGRVILNQQLPVTVQHSQYNGEGAVLEQGVLQLANDNEGAEGSD